MWQRSKYDWMLLLTSLQVSEVLTSCSLGWHTSHCTMAALCQHTSHCTMAALFNYTGEGTHNDACRHIQTPTDTSRHVYIPRDTSRPT